MAWFQDCHQLRHADAGQFQGDTVPAGDREVAAGDAAAQLRPFGHDVEPAEIVGGQGLQFVHPRVVRPHEHVHPVEPVGLE